MVHISRTEIGVLFIAVIVGYITARAVREIWQNPVMAYLASAATVIVVYFVLVALLRRFQT